MLEGDNLAQYAGHQVEVTATRMPQTNAGTLGVHDARNLGIHDRRNLVSTSAGSATGTDMRLRVSSVRSISITCSKQ